MRSVITCIKNPGNADSQYFGVGMRGDSTSVIEFKSNILFTIGESVESNDLGVVSLLDEKLIEQICEKAVAAAHALPAKEPYASQIAPADRITEKMWDKIRGASSLLLQKLMLCAPIIVRFHNDADGASGAFGLYKSLAALSADSPFNYKHNITWLMQGSVSYDPADAMSDIMIANNYLAQEKPLLVMIDFGTAQESNQGIELIKKKFDIIWLDHHPIPEKFAGKDLENYINPWLFGGDSNYTAGFLACVFAKTFSKVKTSAIEDASFIGDYSEYARAHEDGKRLSVLLDLLTSDVQIAFGSSSSNLTPSEIEKLLDDKPRCDELVGYAEMRLSEALASALTSVKMYKADAANIYVLDYEGIRVENTKYPLPGRFSSKLLDKISELNSKPCVVAVHMGRYISVRSAKQLGDTDIPTLITELKERHGDYVLAGGGHKHAAGIKLANDTQKSTILKEIVSMLKKQMAADAG